MSHSEVVTFRGTNLYSKTEGTFPKSLSIDSSHVSLVRIESYAYS